MQQAPLSAWRVDVGHMQDQAHRALALHTVPTHKAEARELRADEEPSTTELVFNPNTGQDMFIACLVSHWQREGQAELHSFAFITDEPPPEVRNAGHDRCIVPLRRENLMTWLTPEGRSLDELDQLIENRARPYYEHALLVA